MIIVFLKNNEVFIPKFISCFIESYDFYNDNPDPELIKPIKQLLDDKQNLCFSNFLDVVCSICPKLPKYPILIIDEIDKFKIKPKILLDKR